MFYIMYKNLLREVEFEYFWKSLYLFETDEKFNHIERETPRKIFVRARYLLEIGGGGWKV